MVSGFLRIFDSFEGFEVFEGFAETAPVSTLPFISDQNGLDGRNASTSIAMASGPGGWKGSQGGPSPCVAQFPCQRPSNSGFVGVPVVSALSTA